jgi:thiamine-monophosphate kinase
MTELEWIEHLRRRLPAVHGELVLGIGDDCAIYRQRGAREDLLLTTDLMIEGVHFRREDTSPAFIGHKSLARGLSDIAAMGGEPKLCLVSLAVPKTWMRHVDDFYRGLLRLARQTGTQVAGGDLSSADRVMIDIIVCGSVTKGMALRRDGAKPGEAIYVSGALGRSAKRGYRLRPVPQLQLGRSLRGRASACIDLSDGLSIDLYRICEASGVSAHLEHVPVATGATLEQALHGGEDYELLYTGPAGLPGILVGRVVGLDPAALITFRDDPLLPAGYDHFA